MILGAIVIFKGLKYYFYFYCRVFLRGYDVACIKYLKVVFSICEV